MFSALQYASTGLDNVNVVFPSQAAGKQGEEESQSWGYHMDVEW